MKRPCQEENAVRYMLQLMKRPEEIKYKAHLKTCEKCRAMIKEITGFYGLLQEKKKQKQKIPSFYSIRFPEKTERVSTWQEIFAGIRMKRALRYVMATSLVL